MARNDGSTPAVGVDDAVQDVDVNLTGTNTQDAAAEAAQDPGPAENPQSTSSASAPLSVNPSEQNFVVYATLVQKLSQDLEQMRKDLLNSNAKSAILEDKIKEMQNDAKKTDAGNDKDKDEVQPPKRPDRKDVEKPDKYSGNTDYWLKWSKSFRKLLRRNDPRWSAVLDTVEANHGKPVTTELEEKWAQDLKISPHLAEFKEQLNEYLESYTIGSANVLVEACGERKALDAWRQLSDKVHSMRETHVHVLRRKAMSIAQ